MKTSTLLFISAGIVILGIAGLVIWKKTAPSQYTAFAQCTSTNGATMYGAWWCPHCAAQKALFGNAIESVHYVECSDANKKILPVCTDAGVTGFPTWKFADGTMLSGEQTLQTLSDKTSCALSPATP